MHTDRREQPRQPTRKRVSRYVSFLLLCAMLFSIFPAFAFADELLTVTFDLNYDRDDRFSQGIVAYGDIMEEPEIPLQGEFMFLGWYTDPYGEFPYNWSAPVTEHLTLYAQWIEFEILEHHAYFIGDAYGNIRPQDNVSRAELATIFFRLISDETRAELWNQENPFIDVELTDWFNNAVSTMTNAGLFTGVDEYHFAPWQQVTRAEVAMVVARFQNLDLTPQEDDSDYPYDAYYPYDSNSPYFSDIAGHWAEDAILAVAREGWVQGHDGAFSPYAPITRAEVAAMVNRMQGRPPVSLADLHPEMQVWADNPAGGLVSPVPIQDPQLTFAIDIFDRMSTEAIVLHHLSADWSIHQVHEYHMTRGWFGVGYHFQVDKDGTIWSGRPLMSLGAHTVANNHNTIGIAVRGRYDTVDRHMPDAQFNALVELIRYLQAQFGEIPVYGHGYFNATACPGRFFPMEEVQLLQYRGDHQETFSFEAAAWYYLYIQEAGNSFRYVRRADGTYELWLELLPPRDWSLLERPYSRPEDINSVAAGTLPVGAL